MQKKDGSIEKVARSSVKYIGGQSIFGGDGAGLCLRKYENVHIFFSEFYKIISILKDICFLVNLVGTPFNPCQLTYAVQVVSIWSCIYISYSVKSCHKRSPPSWQKRQKLIKMSVVSTLLKVSNKRWILLKFLRKLS